MNFAQVGRPVGCLKTALRRTRQQRTFQRSVMTASSSPVTTKPAFSPQQHERNHKVSRFEIYPEIPSTRSTFPDPMPALRQAQITTLDPTGTRTKLFSKEQRDSAKPGDVLMVSTKNGEPFSGALIEIRRRGADTAILLRGQMMKTGVETWFKIYSPTVTGIEIIWRRPKRARRARLTYMRKPKHDMGNVDSLVNAWKKERFVLRSKAKPAGGSARTK